MKEQESDDVCISEEIKKKNRNFPVLNDLRGHSSVDFRVYEVHLNAPQKLLSAKALHV